MMTRRRILVVFASMIGWPAFARQDRELRCRVCGVLIPKTSGYYKSKDGSVVICERCFATAPKCSVCNLPTAPDQIDPETGACPQCLSRLPRCKACGRPIAGKYYTFPYTDGVFCPDCMRNTPKCSVCGVPTGPNYWRYPDGRTICRECGERAVFDLDGIRRIMQEAREIVEGRLGLKVKQPFELRVDKLSGLKADGGDQSGKDGTGHVGLYGKELGIYRRDGKKSEIVLLFGLPLEILYETAAHEYTHAWQDENCPADLEPDLREGFAQWVAAEVLRVKGYKVALERLEGRSDSPYGTGYRRLSRLGLQAILKLIKTHE